MILVGAGRPVGLAPVEIDLRQLVNARHLGMELLAIEHQRVELGMSLFLVAS